MSHVTPSEKEQVLEYLREMDPTEFEAFVARLWEAKGWETEVTKRSGDGAIDFYARRYEPEEESILVQVKRHGKNSYVGEPKLREYAYVARSTPDIDGFAVVTTNRFTKDATILALKEDIDAINGEELAEEAIKHRGKMNDPESGQKARVSAAVGRRPSSPSLPSPIAGYNWLISPVEQDRWRNVVSLSVIILLGCFILFMITAGPPPYGWVEWFSFAGITAGYFGSTYGVFKDLRVGMRKSLIFRIYATLVVASLPIIAPLIYLKIRGPTE